MADLRALQDSISRQKGLIPPAQDQFFGQEMKPQRGLVENILRMLSNPSDPGIGPMAMEAPVAAMVPTAANLPQFQASMAKIADAIMEKFPKGSQAFREAASFARTRYPYMTGNIKKLIPRTNYTWADTELGKFWPGANNAYITQKTPQGEETVANMVNSIMHEARHAKSLKKTPQIFWDKLNPLEENRAYQAGDTAEQAYQDYLKLIGK